MTRETNATQICAILRRKIHFSVSVLHFCICGLVIFGGLFQMDNFGSHQKPFNSVEDRFCKRLSIFYVFARLQLRSVGEFESFHCILEMIIIFVLNSNIFV